MSINFGDYFLSAVSGKFGTLPMLYILVLKEYMKMQYMKIEKPKI